MLRLATLFATCCAMVLAAHLTRAAHADDGPPLSCAVEAAPSPGRELEGLCAKLSHELGRPVRVVDDVRAIKRGRGVQIIATDVTWYVVLLDAGRVRAFTRISVVEARGHEAQFVARAVRGLSAAKPIAPSACLRVDPDSAQAPKDIVYPWAELVPCTRTVLDVRDPWWIPTAK